MTTATVYLIRGLSREQGHWGRFIPSLQKAFPDIRIVCLEIPGSGVYCRVPSPSSISEIVDFMRRDYLRIISEGPRYLVSISLGGMIAIEWMRAHPSDFTQSIIINSSLRGVSPIWKRLRLRNVTRLLHIAMTRPLDKKEYLGIEMVSNRPDLYPEQLRLWVDIQKRRPITTANAARQLLAAIRYRPPLKGPPIPTLILNSVQDRMVHTDCSRDIAARWGLPIHFHPNAGHEMTMDDPDWVIHEMSEWFHLA